MESTLSLVGKKSMYLFYDHTNAPDSEWTHTLCRIDLTPEAEGHVIEKQSPTPILERIVLERISIGTGAEEAISQTPLWQRISVDTDCDERQEITPILKFRDDGQNPRGMRCACLDSKLYILGGVVQNQQGDVETLPKEVHVFDLSTQHLNKFNSQLNSGKPCPVVFAANRKLYALANLGSVSWSRSDWSPVTMLSEINLFECYDPNTDQWRVLDDPPADRHTTWHGCTVLHHDRKVVFYGEDTTRCWDQYDPNRRFSPYHPDHNPEIHVTFDLDQEKWALPIPIAAHADVNHDNLTLQVGDGMNVYGLEWGVPSKSNSGFFGSLTAANDDWVKACDDDVPMHVWDRHPPIPDHYTEAKLLRYAGDGYLYYVVSAAAPHPEGYDWYGGLSPDPNTQLITVTLLRDLDQGKQGFNAKVLTRHKFAIKTSYSGLADLVTCFLHPNPSLAEVGQPE